MAVLGLVVGTGSRSSAGIIYDNLARPSGGIKQIANRPISMSFTTGSETSVLTDIVFKLARINPATGSVTVSLLSDASLMPGGVLATLGTLADSAVSVAQTGYNPKDYSVRVDTTYLLAANTRYWLQLRSDNGSQIAWMQASSPGGVGINGEYAAFTSPGTGAVTVSPNSALSFSTQMKLTTAAAPASAPSPTPLAVPEPSSLALCLVGATAGLAGAARAHRRRRASQAD